LSADAIRLRREHEQLKARVDVLETLLNQLMENQALAKSPMSKTLKLPSKDAKAN